MGERPAVRHVRPGRCPGLLYPAPSGRENRSGLCPGLLSNLITGLEQPAFADGPESGGGAAGRRGSIEPATNENNAMVATDRRMPDVDWAAAEELLVRVAAVRFPEIAAQYPAEEFYGVFFDCDVVYTSVQGHMNTNALLRWTAEASLRSRPKTKAQLSPGRSVEEVMEELRWDGGGWKHFGIFDTPSFDQIAAEYHALVAERGGLEAERILKEDFMQMACRAVVRLERSGVFDCLRRTPDFRVLCVYIQETIDDGDRRLKDVRRSFS